MAAVFVTSLALSACADAGSSGPQTTTAPPTTEATEATGAAEPTGTGGTPATTTPRTETGSSSPTTSSALALTPLGVPDTLPKENWDHSGVDLDIDAVRAATHDDFDRVVFDISGTGTPGWVVEHTMSPVSQGSGFPIEYHGDIALSVNLLGFAGPLYVGGIPGSGGIVTEVVQDINHHGTSQLIIGLERETPFSVTLLEEPTRLVVDILHDPAPAETSPLGTPNLDPKQQNAGALHQQVITGVRLANHRTFDRVVFDLVGSGTPGWRTDFTAEPGQAASGLPIDYDGDIALEVTLTGVSPRGEDGSQQPDLGTIPGAGGVINEVISAVTFEGESQFIIGLDAATPYSMTLLDEPQRVVVDILHR